MFTSFGTYRKERKQVRLNCLNGKQGEQGAMKMREFNTG